MKSFVILVSLFSTAVALAQDPSSNDAQSKENQVFEAQGENGLVISLLKALKRLGVGFAENTDGTLSISDSYVMTPSNSLHRINVSMESRIYGVKETPFKNCESDEVDCSDWHPGALLIPVEVRVRANADTMTKAELAELKVGAVRLLMEKYSITLQGLSYFYKSNELGMATYEGFEIANVTLNDVSKLSADNEFIVKLSFGFGLSGMYSNKTRVAATAAQTYTGTPDASDKDVAGYYTTSASVGWRYKKKVLLDLYGGYDRVGDNMRFEGEGLEYYSKRSTVLRDGYVGAGVRYMPSKWVNFKVLAQRNWTRVDSSFNYGDEASAQDKERANTVTGGLELRW